MNLELILTVNGTTYDSEAISPRGNNGDYVVTVLDGDSKWLSIWNLNSDFTDAVFV